MAPDARVESDWSRLCDPSFLDVFGPLLGLS